MVVVLMEVVVDGTKGVGIWRLGGRVLIGVGMRGNGRSCKRGRGHAWIRFGWMLRVDSGAKSRTFS